MAQPSILVTNKPNWISLKLFLRRSTAKILNLKTIIPALLILDALCITGMLFLLCDSVAGERYDVDGVVHLTQQFLLSSLQFINGALGLLVGFSVLTDGCLSRIKGECLYRWNIRRLPRVAYGSLVEEGKREKCGICLEGIGEEEIVRTLPNCKHYNLHGRCIGQWLLCQSSCPVCRAPVCR